MNLIHMPILGSGAPPRAVTTYIPQQYLNPGLSLAQLAAILWAWRKVGCSIAAVVVVGVAFACAVWPRTYLATATLMVNFDVNDPLGGKEFPVGLLGSYMSTQIELARGSEVLLPMIDKLKLTSNKDYAGSYRGDPAGLRSWIEAKVRKKLLVEQGRYGSQLMYVSYTASSADEAARVANAVAEIYSQQQFQRLSGPAIDRAQRYTEQLAELKTKVNRAQDDVTVFRQESGLIAGDTKNDLDMELLSALEHRLQEAQNLRRSAAARQGTDASVSSSALNSTTLQALKAQLSTQNAHMAQLRLTLGANHPERLETQSQISRTQAELKAELGAYSSNASSELLSASQIERELLISVQQQRAKVAQQHGLQDAAAKYQLQLESTQAVYKRALDGYDQVMFASTGGYNNVNFVSRATPPPDSASPKVRVALLLAVVGGIALGIGIPLAYEMLKRRVRCRDDVERDHGIGVLIELSTLGSPSLVRSWSQL
jgi:uncharacterized protein involved in exopolysaccharide biosynthesis